MLARISYEGRPVNIFPPAALNKRYWERFPHLNFRIKEEWIFGKIVNEASILIGTDSLTDLSLSLCPPPPYRWCFPWIFLWWSTSTNPVISVHFNICFFSKHEEVVYTKAWTYKHSFQWITCTNKTVQFWLMKLQISIIKWRVYRTNAGPSLGKGLRSVSLPWESAWQSLDRADSVF